MSIRVAVVGAGAVGLCCAVALAEAGARVTLFDRGLPGAANSTLTGGGIRQQFGTATNIALSLIAAPFWQGFADRFGVDPFFKATGYLFLAHDAEGARGLQETVSFQNAHGVDSDYLDAAEIARRWPALPASGITGGGFRQGDGWANQHRILDGLTRGALAVGVVLETGCEVLALTAAGGRVVGVTTVHGTLETDAVVLASGPWTELLAPLGLKLPVEGKRHELLIVEPAAPLPADIPWLIGVRDQIHVRPDTPGRALVGGFMGHDDTAPPDAFETRADQVWTAAVLARVTDALGVIGRNARVHRGWAGLYPSTPDRHPVIDRLGEGLYAAMGFSGTGLMHAPAAGQIIRELVIDGKVSAIAIDALTVDRFDDNIQPEKTGF